MTKAELLERLLTVEQVYAEVQQQLAHLQFQLLEQEHQNAEQQLQERRHHKQTSEGENSNDCALPIKNGSIGR